MVGNNALAVPKSPEAIFHVYVSPNSSLAPVAFCLRVMVSVNVPAVTVIVASRAVSVSFLETVTSNVVAVLLPMVKLVSSLDSAVHPPSTLVSTVTVTVSPSAEIVVLDATALR